MTKLAQTTRAMSTLLHQLFSPCLVMILGSFTTYNKNMLIKGSNIPLSACAKIIAGIGFSATHAK